MSILKKSPPPQSRASQPRGRMLPDRLRRPEWARQGSPTNHNYSQIGPPGLLLYSRPEPHNHHTPTHTQGSPATFKLAYQHYLGGTTKHRKGPSKVISDCHGPETARDPCSRHSAKTMSRFFCSRCWTSLVVSGLWQSLMTLDGPLRCLVVPLSSKLLVPTPAPLLFTLDNIVHLTKEKCFQH